MADALVKTDEVRTVDFVEQHSGFESRVSPWIRRCSVSTPPLQLVKATPQLNDLGASEKNTSMKARKAHNSQLHSETTCTFCGKDLGDRNSSGRRRIYCTQSCRQRAYQSRKRASQLGLRDGEQVVSLMMITRVNKGLKSLAKALAEVENKQMDSTDESVSALCAVARKLGKLTLGHQGHFPSP
jgi:hypothetical protein